MEAELHLLRLYIHLQDEQAQRAANPNAGEHQAHRSDDPCVLSATDHLLVQATNSTLDALEELCTETAKLHTAIRPFHKRILGLLHQLRFPQDVERVLAFLVNKVGVSSVPRVYK